MVGILGHAHRWGVRSPQQPPGGGSTLGPPSGHPWRSCSLPRTPSPTPTPKLQWKILEHCVCPVCALDLSKPHSRRLLGTQEVRDGHWGEGLGLTRG